MNMVSSGDRLLLDVPAALAASLRDRLDSLVFAEDVQVTDESNRLRVWTVINPSAPDAAGRSLPAIVADVLPSEHRSFAQINLETFEVIRVERGIPKFLVDMNEETIPLEAGIEDLAISFTKGCYVGQEIIVRVTHRGGGRVAKRLVRWRAGKGNTSVPSFDARIISGEKEIGRVTSSAFSPGLERVVGLGYVQRDFAEAGTKVTVVWNDARVEAEVT
jgi:folate-binding protein YgfZ